MFNQISSLELEIISAVLLHSFFYLYSHTTVIEVLTMSNPRLLFALQLNTTPLTSLLRFARCRVSDVDSTLSYPSIVHVMSGCGLPVALQNRVKLIPSTTTLFDGAVTITGETTEKVNKLSCSVK